MTPDGTSLVLLLNTIDVYFGEKSSDWQFLQFDPFTLQGKGICPLSIFFSDTANFIIIIIVVMWISLSWLRGTFQDVFITSRRRKRRIARILLGFFFFYYYSFNTSLCITDPILFYFMVFCSETDVQSIPHTHSIFLMSPTTFWWYTEDTSH